jgi:hypothetical protein
MLARRDVSLGSLCGAFVKLTRQPMLAFFAFLYAPLVAVLGIQYLSGLSGPLSPEGDRVVIGDFLAFQTGAVILADGRGLHLYDLRLQREMQSRLVGEVSPEWQPYVNPPLLAIALRPLAGMGTIDAFRFYSAAMACAGLLGAAASESSRIWREHRSMLRRSSSSRFRFTRWPARCSAVKTPCSLGRFSAALLGPSPVASR